MTQQLPPAGWYPDPQDAQQQRYWDGTAWTQHQQPVPSAAPAPPTPVPQPQQPVWQQPGATILPGSTSSTGSTGWPGAVAVPTQSAAAPTPYSAPGMAATRRFTVTSYNQRMANRIARRAKLNEPAVAVAFTFNNLLTMVVFGFIEDVAKVIPTIGDVLELGISLISFYFHRIVLVTNEHVYIYRDWPFHIPGERLAGFDRGPGVVRIGSDRPGGFSGLIRRGQLTFHDGTVVYHSPIWIKRAQYIAQEGNIPRGQ